MGAEPPVTVIGALLAAGSGSRFEGPMHKLRAPVDERTVLEWSLDAMLGAGFDAVVVVVGEDDFADLIVGRAETVHCSDWVSGQAHSLRAAIDHARRNDHRSLIVGIADQPLVGTAAWVAVGEAGSPIAMASFAGDRRPPVRLARSVWSDVPTEGDVGARALIDRHPERVEYVAVAGDPIDVDRVADLTEVRRRVADRRAVTRLIGREPRGRFDVVVRDDDGEPIVLRNHPVLDDGTPMPTRYWLCGAREQVLVGRLESLHGVRRAEAAVGLERIADAHDRYRLERDAAYDADDGEYAHRPTGGVGGTRRGVKCLHAHYAWWLAGGDDPVGQWVADHLHEVDHDEWPRHRTEPGGRSETTT